MDIGPLITFLTELAASLGLKLLVSVLILAVGLFLTKKLKKFIRKSDKLSMVDEGLRSFLSSFSVIVAYIVLFITIAMILGVPTTSFITVLASCGVAVGLALQGSLSNFAGGIMILIFKPFKIGDYIESAGEAGIVTEITIVYTIILTVDNKRISLPNGTLANAVIKNYSSEKIRRVDLTFNAAYSCDSDKVKEIINKVISEHPCALKDPAAFVRMSNHGDNSIEYTARIWCKNEDYWTVYFDILEGVKASFDKENISIPFPQMDVHVINK